MLPLLALDTVTEACSVALWTGDRMITRFEEPGRGHALRVLPMVDSVLAEAGLSLQQLGGIAVGVGPGAFTGVRISVSVAQGLAFGAGLPLIPVSSLEALALQAFEWSPSPLSVLACLDARMGDLYWGWFRADPARGVIALGDFRVGKPGQLAWPASWQPAFGEAAGIGRGMRILAARAPWPGRCDADALPRAEQMARLGRLRLSLGEGVEPAEIVPVYLRDKVALTEAERAAAK
jgi:tRNA threonylcarbamoyladenosine biosynthesis protein TsaB